MTRLRFAIGYALLLSTLGGPLALLTSCAELGPVMSALPGVVSAVEAVTAAAAAQHRPLDAEVLAEAKALDAARLAHDKAQLKLILAAVRRKPAPCPPAPVAAPAAQPAPTVAAVVPQPLVADAGAEGGAR